MRRVVLLCVAVVTSTLTAWPGTARAAQRLERLTGPVTATATNHGFDGVCPPDPDPTYTHPDPHVAFDGTIHRNGVALRVRLDACIEFTAGALGGNNLGGMFTISGPEGAVFGTLVGGDGHSRHDYLGATLTIVGGTRGLAHESGRLFFSGCSGGTFIPDGPLLNATVSTSGIDPRCNSLP